MTTRIHARLVTAGAALTFAGGALVLAPNAVAEEPECVTGLSYVLDAVETGSSAGPPIVFSTGISVIGIVLPPADSPAGPVISPLFQEFASAFRSATTAASENGVAFAQQTKTAIEPLAAGTENGDSLTHQGADAIDELADTLGPAIQPADRTMRQTASAMRTSTCAP